MQDHPIYDAVVTETKINPHRAWQADVVPPTKRQKHKAGKLTALVFAAITAGQDPGTVSPEITQEIPVAAS